MYGNLQEMDVNSLLSFISREQKSGLLFLETPSHFSIKNFFYFIFFDNGNIIFAGDQQSFDLQRLQEYLTYYKLSDKIQHIEEKLINSINIAEYEAILLLSEQNLITTNQEKSLLKKIIEEILFNVITLTKGNFIWQGNFKLQPLIIQFKVDSIVPKMTRDTQNWDKLNPYIKFSQQYPIITDNFQLKLFFSENLYTTLWEKIDGKTSFLQLSRYLHQNLATVGQIIYPYIEMGWIKIKTPFLLLSVNQYSSTKTFNIVCLTKDKNWAFQTEKLLELKKCNLLSADNLMEGLNYILKYPLDLVVLDSEFDTNEQYQLCKIVRNTDNIRNIPIIFLVNKYKYKYNFMAKIYGVTECMSKKIFNQNLLKIIDKHLRD